MVNSPKILAIRLSALGDVVLALRVLPSNAEVHFLTKQKFSSIAKRAERVRDVLTLSDHASLGELLQLAKTLQQNKYDAVLDLHSNLRSRILCFFLNAPVYRIRKPRIREALLFFLRKKLWKAIGFQTIDRVKMLKAAVQKWQNTSLKESATQSLGVLKLHSEKVQKNAFVAIAPDSAWRQKEWGLERFEEIAKRLLARGENVAWVGLKPPSESLVNLGVKNYVGRVSLEENIEILASAKVLLCNDAGLMHLAEAVGTPVLSVFGPTTRELGFAPSHSKSKILETDLWCRPCSKSGKWCFRLAQPQKCLRDLEVETVWKTLEGWN